MFGSADDFGTIDSSLIYLVEPLESFFDSVRSDKVDIVSSSSSLHLFTSSIQSSIVTFLSNPSTAVFTLFFILKENSFAFGSVR